jgi:hypothetical protein
MDLAVPPIPRFIVGLPRSATTWMCRSLNEHPDVAAFGETMFFGKAWIPPGRDGRYDAAALEQIKRALLAKPFESTLVIPGPGRMKYVDETTIGPLLTRVFAELPMRPTPGEVFGMVAASIARAERKSQWVEKTPHHLLSAGRILREFPNARFVVMLREPYSFLLSYKHHQGHDRTPASRERFRRRYHALGGALVWRNSWRAAEKLAQTKPEQTLVVNQEQIGNDPQATMRSVIEFLQLPPVDRAFGVAARINSAFDRGVYATLTDADIAWMNWIAGSALRAAGHEPKRWRRDAEAIARSVLDLPLWAFRVARDLKDTTDGSLSRHILRWLARSSRS